MFRCTSYFMNPQSTSLDGEWHRDSQYETADEAAERALVLSGGDISMTSRMRPWVKRMSLVRGLDQVMGHMKAAEPLQEVESRKAGSLADHVRVEDLPHRRHLENVALLLRQPHEPALHIR